MRNGTGLLLVAMAAAVIGSAAVSQTRASPSEREQSRIDTMMQGRQPGAPVTCIQQRQIRETHHVDGQSIYYRMRDGTIYRNQPAGGCPGLTSYRALQVQTSSTQLCRGDIVIVQDFQQGFSPGNCGLSDFVPFRPVR